jgi:hypothetical protein
MIGLPSSVCNTNYLSSIEDDWLSRRQPIINVREKLVRQTINDQSTPGSKVDLLKSVVWVP